jgi:hypothetical protein
MHQTFEDLLVATVVERNQTIEQLMADPELDEWIYSINDGPKAFAPSTFVAALYGAAGLFEEFNLTAADINYSEFTVKDIYDLDFFTKEGPRSRPQACQEADPHLGYCQLTGQYRI